VLRRVVSAAAARAVHVRRGGDLGVHAAVRRRRLRVLRRLRGACSGARRARVSTRTHKTRREMHARARAPPAPSPSPSAALAACCASSSSARSPLGAAAGAGGQGGAIAFCTTKKWCGHDRHNARPRFLLHSVFSLSHAAPRRVQAQQNGAEGASITQHKKEGTYV
jgi:hypothetical protein